MLELGLAPALVLVLGVDEGIRHRVNVKCSARCGGRKNRSGRARARCRVRTGCTAKARARGEVVPVRVLKIAFRDTLYNLYHLRLAPAQGSDPKKSASAPGVSPRKRSSQKLRLHVRNKGSRWKAGLLAAQGKSRRATSAGSRSQMPRISPYTLKVNEFTTIEVGYRVWSGLKHLGTEYLDQPLVDATKGAVTPVKNQVQCGNTSTYFVTKTIAGDDSRVPREAQRVWQRIRLTVGSL